MPPQAQAGSAARAVVNVGNTRTRFVRHEAEGWVEDRCVPTAELLAALSAAEPGRALALPDWPVEWAISLASVVPAASDGLLATWGAPRRGLKRITSASRADLRLDYAPPSSLGADRFCNAVALRAGPGWGIAVDCGTATTLTVVTPEGALVGGAILPGVGTAFKSLAAGTAQLPEAPADVPSSPWGRTTHESIQLGVVVGQAGAIAHLVARMRAALPAGCPVVLTGGWSSLLAPSLPSDFRLEANWTLEGARLAYAEA